MQILWCFNFFFILQKSATIWLHVSYRLDGVLRGGGLTKYTQHPNILILITNTFSPNLWKKKIHKQKPDNFYVLWISAYISNTTYFSGLFMYIFPTKQLFQRAPVRILKTAITESLNPFQRPSKSGLSWPLCPGFISARLTWISNLSLSLLQFNMFYWGLIYSASCNVQRCYKASFLKSNKEQE